MSWKSIACLAAVAAITAPAVAQPTISLVDNMDGTGVLNVTTDAAGSLAAELSLSLSGATLTGATINSAIFDEANPGDNPFTLTVTNGLEIDGNNLFASFGAGDQGIGTFPFLDFTYTGTGTADASGLVAQLGLLGEVVVDSIPVGAVVGNPADFNGDGVVDLLDLDILGTNFNLNPATMAQGDANGDGTVDLLDLDILGTNFGFGTSSATSVPEPTSVALGLLALAGVAAARRR